MDFLRIIPIPGFLLFLFLIAFRTRKLKHKGVDPIVKKTGIKSIFKTILLLLFFLIFTAELLFQLTQQKHSILPDVLRIQIHSIIPFYILGAILISLSIISLYFTLQAFADSLRFGMNAEKQGRLITTGIFSLSRNPFFVSIELLFTGIAFTIPTPFFIAIALLSSISIHFFILKEEKFLQKHYRKEYLDYCKQVRRYF